MVDCGLSTPAQSERVEFVGYLKKCRTLSRVQGLQRVSHRIVLYDAPLL
jgi:hypothetical protein